MFSSMGVTRDHKFFVGKEPFKVNRLGLDRSLVLEGFRWFPLVKSIHMNPELDPRRYLELVGDFHRAKVSRFWSGWDWSDRSKGPV